MPKSTDKRVQASKKLAKMLAPKTNYISAAELRHNSAAVLSRVAVGGERIVLTRNRKPVAALVPMEDVPSLRKASKRS